jgi:hypothetical protein
MSDLSIFTAVNYGNNEKTISQSMLEKCDDFFFLRGRKAFVVQGRMENGKQAVILSEARTTLLRSATKVMLYFTVFIPLLVLALKLILRAFHKFSVLDPRKELEKGLNVTKDMKDKVQALMPQILARTEHTDVIHHDKVGDIAFSLTEHTDVIHHDKDGDIAFSLKEHPDVIFKAISPNVKTWTASGYVTTEKLFDHMVTAKAAMLAHNLGLLVLPQATKFNVNLDGKPHAFIAMQKLPFVDDRDVQEKNYHDHADQLDETTRQLAAFVINSDLGHDGLPYFPVLDEANKPLKVALVHLNQLSKTRDGVLALIRCASRKQIDIIVAEARKANIDLDEVNLKQEIEKREKFIKHYEDLHNFYNKKGIVKGDEVLAVDYDQLGLDLTEKTDIKMPKANEASYDVKSINLRQVVEIVINEINAQIQAASADKPIKGCRSVLLNTNRGPLCWLQRAGIPAKSKMTAEEENKARWIYRVIQALIDRGHIFSLDNENGHGYFIQA